MSVAETFHGFIETTQDVLLVLEGCRRGLLPRIGRRLQERERDMIQSGSVFVFDGRESGIKRWTDGRVWSPSRILGSFLIYRELTDRRGSQQREERRGRSGSHPRSSLDRRQERQLIGSLSDTYRFRKDGLIKKTMSVVVNGVSQHLISYYDPQDVMQNKLRTPCSVPELSRLEISPELLYSQSLRQSSMDQEGQPPRTPPPYSHRVSSFRSMSMGSLHALQGEEPTEPKRMMLPPRHPQYPHPRQHTSLPTEETYAMPNASSVRRLSTPHLGQLLNPVHPLQPTSWMNSIPTTAYPSYHDPKWIMDDSVHPPSQDYHHARHGEGSEVPLNTMLLPYTTYHHPTDTTPAGSDAAGLVIDDARRFC